MGTVSLTEYTEDATGAWAGVNAGSVVIELPFMLAATALGLPEPNRRLLIETIELHVSLIQQLVVCSPGAPLRLRNHFGHASYGLRRFACESIGLAAATAMAELRHAWNAVDGWPLDLDVAGHFGIRPDLLFPVPGGQVAGECRGRNAGRRRLAPLAAQSARMLELAGWQAQNTKTFMVWASASPARTRLDYFDPGTVRPIVDEDDLARALQQQALVAFGSALNSDRARYSTPIGTVCGTWMTGPGSPYDVFAGLLEPDAEPMAWLASSQPMATNVNRARVGPVIVAVRPTGSDRPLESILD